MPWEGHRTTLEGLRDQLAGKVVVDCVNPIGFDKQGAYALAVPEGSAAEQAAAVLTESTVVGAFHHVSAVLLNDEGSGSGGTATSWSSATTATRPISSRRSPVASTVSAACMRAGCATRTRWRR